MFAFALWDREKRLLPGSGPPGEALYYGRVGPTLFGSELKALCAHPGFSAEIDRDASPSMPGTPCAGALTIYRGISKLEPDIATINAAGDVSVAAYWRLAMRSRRANVTR
jgi:asparagine synthase (glutamine-hydrolysing)